MKKIVYLFAAVLLFASCEKDEIGGTATESMAGQWYVHVDAVDENGALVYSDEDLFDLGNFLLLTYNVADNKSDVMFVDDLEVEGFSWSFKTKVDCDLSALTFSAPESDKYVYATEYDGDGEYTYNNFCYKARKFDAEMWAWYKEGEKQYNAGVIKKDSLDKMLDEYFAIADDSVSAGYFVKYAGKEFEVGQNAKGEETENAFNITITNGAIIKGAATTPSGMPADSIVFYVEFDDDYTKDDEGNLVYAPEAYGFKNYRISGYRYTGFAKDE